MIAIKVSVAHPAVACVLIKCQRRLVSHVAQQVHDPGAQRGGLPLRQGQHLRAVSFTLQFRLHTQTSDDRDGIPNFKRETEFFQIIRFHQRYRADQPLRFPKNM